MMKLRSICQAVKEIREYDPDTAMTESFLKRLVEDGEVSSEYCGERICFDMGTLEKDLIALFCLETESIPKLRTIRDAVKEIRETDRMSTISEYKVRMWVKESRLHSYAVGSRQIVAMEDFDFSRLFAKSGYPSKKNRTPTVKVSEQYGELLSRTTQGYTCQRKR